MAEHLQSALRVESLRRAPGSGLHTTVSSLSPSESLSVAAGTSTQLTRRALLVGLGGVVLASCSRDLQRDDLVPIARENRQPGEPLWSAATNSFVVAVTPDGRDELAAMGPAFTVLANPGLIAVVNECTYDPSHRNRLAWCRPDDVLTCLDCGSGWTRFGTLVHGPATRNLTFLTITINGDDDVIIDRTRRMDGPQGAARSAAPSCVQTFAAPT